MPKNIRNLLDWVSKTAWLALQGQTPRPLRQYSFAVDIDEKTITFKAEVDRELDAAEMDDLWVVEGEVNAQGIFNEEEKISTIVSIVSDQQLLSPLPGGVIYRREA